MYLTLFYSFSCFCSALRVVEFSQQLSLSLYLDRSNLDVCSEHVYNTVAVGDYENVSVLALRQVVGVVESA